MHVDGRLLFLQTSLDSPLPYPVNRWSGTSTQWPVPGWLHTSGNIMIIRATKKFLSEIGYPLIKSSAQFTADYLWHKPDGTYTAAPSTSPEHGPVDQGATFVHAVVREILSDAISASKILGVDAKSANNGKIY